MSDHSPATDTPAEAPGACTCFGHLSGTQSTFTDAAGRRCCDFCGKPLTAMTDTPVEALEPLPCPFCGCPDIIASNVGEDEDNWFVGCMEAQCGVNPGVFCPDSEAEAIAAWNRRALSTPPQAPGVVEPLEWVKHIPSDFMSRAECVLGVYRVWTHHEAEGEWYWSIDGLTSRTVASEAEGHAAAQADYERRILSTLVSAPTVSAGELVAKLGQVENALRQPGLMLTHTKAACADDVAEAAAALTAANADRDRLAAEVERMSTYYFMPNGDNHHNAVRCPHCNPEKIDPEKERSRAEAAETDRDRLARELEEAREALREARSHFITESDTDGKVLSVGYDSKALPKVVVILDAALKGDA